MVLDEGQETNLEMVRLARGKRYFDEGFTPMQQQSAVSCWRCGKRGHLARECPRGINERPCHLCAQYGHESRSCPHRESGGGMPEGRGRRLASRPMQRHARGCHTVPARRNAI